MRRMLVAVASGVVLLSCALAAHHANAVFDLGKRLTLTGTVTEWFWANPHCLLRFDVKNDSGEMMHWVAETQAPPNMTASRLVALASSAGRPSRISTGKETAEPEEARVLTSPHAKPAPSRAPRVAALHRVE